jgi:hypothetical protein
VIRAGIEDSLESVLDRREDVFNGPWTAELRTRRLVILEVEREAALAVVEANKVKEAIRLAEWDKP